jgi:hypothetical protein
VKTICEKCKWEMHTKFSRESVKKWVIKCKIRMVFKRMWEVFYRQCQYSEFSHGLDRYLPLVGKIWASAIGKIYAPSGPTSSASVASGVFGSFFLPSPECPRKARRRKQFEFHSSVPTHSTPNQISHGSLGRRVEERRGTQRAFSQQRSFAGVHSDGRRVPKAAIQEPKIVGFEI